MIYMISYIEQGQNQQRYCINSHAQLLPSHRDNNILVLCNFMEIQDSTEKHLKTLVSILFWKVFHLSHCHLQKFGILFSTLNCFCRSRSFPVVLKMLLQCTLLPGLVLYITSLSSHSLWLSLVHINYLRMKIYMKLEITNFVVTWPSWAHSKYILLRYDILCHFIYSEISQY